MKHLSRIPFLHLALIFLAMMPGTMVVPVIKDIVKDRLGGENIGVASFISISMLGAFIFAPIAGYISDRLRNRKTLISIFALIDSFCFFLLSQADHISSLLFYRFVEGSVSIFVIGLLLASISDRENHIQSRYFRKGILIGLASTALALGAGMGLPLGVFGRTNPLIPYYVAIGIMLFIALLSLVYLRDAPIHQESKANISLVYKAVIVRPLILLPSAYTFIDRFTVGFFISSFNIHLRENLGFDAGEAGIAMGLVLIPMALLSYPASRFAYKKGVFLPILSGSLFYGCFQILAGYMTDTTLLLSCLFLCGLGAGIMFTPSMLFASLIAPEGLRATTMSIFLGCGALGFMIGPIFFSLLEKYLGGFLDQPSIIPTLAILAGGLEILMVLGTLPYCSFLQKEIRENDLGN